MPGEIDSVRDQSLDLEAVALYSDQLPYHNFEHVQDTLTAANAIIERCRVEHIRLDAEVVYYALLFHDAGYHKDHLALGHRNKEAYSAELAEQALGKRSINAGIIEKTVAAILATERDATFVSAEQKVVRAADLSGMGEPYPDFLKKSLKLKREYEVLNQTKLDWAGWQRISRDVLGFYLRQEIRLTSYFYDESGESAFHQAVRSNLQQLLLEPNEPTLA